MDAPDPYGKLQPPPPTPDDEICRCVGAPPIKLMCALSYNPIHCMDCNLEVRPETLALKEPLVEAIAFWRSIHDAIYELWLASGEYESWAQEQLADIASPVNREGRAVQVDLNGARRCYYWYFQDQSAEDYQTITCCPVCGDTLNVYPGVIFKQLICETCSIVTPGD
jgi:predicted  nucleic acid-binding Zn ribbon protein